MNEPTTMDVGHGPVYDAATWLIEHGPELSSAANDPATMVGLAAGGLGAAGLVAAGVRAGSAAYHGAKAAVLGLPGDIVVGQRREAPVHRLTRPPVHVSWNDRLMHSQVLGPTGSAKTSLLTTWAIQDLKARRKVVVIEIFGDLASGLVPYAKAMGVPIYRCDASVTKSLKWNPLAGDDVEAVAERLAAAIRSMSDHDYWSPVSANIARNLVAVAKRYARHRGREADVALVELLAGEPRFFRQVVGARRGEDRAWTATAPFLDRRLRWWTEETMSWSNETRQKNVSGVSNRLRELLATQAARRTMCPGPGDRLLDIGEAVDRGLGGLIVLRFPVDLFRPGPARLAAALALRQLQAVTLDRPHEGAPPVASYLDEFPALVGRSPGAAEEASDWLALVRKHNCAVTVAYQTRASVPEVLAGALESNGRNVFIAGGLGADDLMWAQRTMGRETRAVEDVRTTTGPHGKTQVSKSKREEERYRRTEGEIRHLPRGQWLALVMRKGNVQPPVRMRSPKPPPPRSYLPRAAHRTRRGRR